LSCLIFFKKTIELLCDIIEASGGDLLVQSSHKTGQMTQKRHSLFFATSLPDQSHLQIYYA